MGVPFQDLFSDNISEQVRVRWLSWMVIGNNPIQLRLTLLNMNINIASTY